MALRGDMIVELCPIMSRNMEIMGINSVTQLSIDVTVTVPILRHSNTFDSFL
jgi:hypothetical protein